MSSQAANMKVESWLNDGRVGDMSLGERIKEQRTKLGWTQDALAEKAGISKGFLSDLENSKRNVSADTLLDLAKVLGLSLDYLMTGEDGERNVREAVEIPAELAGLAEKENIPFPKILLLLQMRRQIVAHRSSSRRQAAEVFDWHKFYRSVRDFM
jgi:transcriptional regulator with XRE-family HTH domain